MSLKGRDEISRFIGLIDNAASDAVGCGGGEMASETIKVILMLSLFGVLQAALHWPQVELRRVRGRHWK
jgi:hypothetical protein